MYTSPNELSKSEPFLWMFTQGNTEYELLKETLHVSSEYQEKGLIRVQTLQIS